MFFLRNITRLVRDWAVAQRALDANDAAVQSAFQAGRILRTHVLRPTWHFVAPVDIRWLLALTAPRVHALSACYYRKHGLDAAMSCTCCRTTTSC